MIMADPFINLRSLLVLRLVHYHGVYLTRALILDAQLLQVLVDLCVIVVLLGRELDDRLAELVLLTELLEFDFFHFARPVGLAGRVVLELREALVPFELETGLFVNAVCVDFVITVVDASCTKIHVL